MVTALIFDCFGVLVSDALETIVTELGVSQPQQAAQIRALIIAANKGVIDADSARQAVADELGMSVSEYSQAVRTGEVKNTALLNDIKDLKKRYKIGLLSNISAGGLAFRFSTQELREHFDVVIASSDIGVAKPDPRAYITVAEQLAESPEHCLMIDDREDYCQGAQAAGMHALRYQSYAQYKHDLVKYI